MIGVYCYAAQRHGWVDRPNERSSHSQITPRGAGLVIALLAGAVALLYSPTSSFCLSISMGLGIAAVGWWDDIRNLAALPRFLLYGLCSLLAMILMGVQNPITPLNLLLFLVTLIGLLWLINLYNFMDGINGLAAFEALFVLVSAVALDASSNFNQIHLFIYCIGGIVAGFLIWNFPIAKVFMGDVGSAFLGFLLGMLALWSHRLGGPDMTVWLMLLGVFIVDTSYTLIVRIGTGQRWHQAHRSHAYQRLNELLGTHTKTVILLMGVNIAWLLPCAWVLQQHWLPSIVVLVIAYIPLIAACYALKAGIPEETGV